MALRAGYYGVKRKIWESLQVTTSKNVQDIADISEMLTINESSCGDIITGATVSSSYGNHIMKYGNVVTLVLGLDGVNCSAWDTIATIPQGFRPKYDLRDISYQSFNVDITKEGLIRAVADTTNGNPRLAITWITPLTSSAASDTREVIEEEPIVIKKSTRKKTTKTEEEE